MSMRAQSSVVVVALLLWPWPGATARSAASQSAPPQPARKQEAPARLTSQDVVRMIQAGLSDVIVIATIRATKATNFETSADALVSLKRAGVSEAVMAVMLDPNAPTTPAATTEPGPPLPPTAPAPAAAAPVDAYSRPHEAGIYLDNGGADKLVSLEPAVFSQGKTGGVFASAMTYGLYKAKWKAIVRSPRANIRTSVQQPTFYFYFDQKSSGGPGGFSGWLASATSPNEFVLAQMTEKRDSRELVVGEFGAFGSSSGTRSEDTVPLKIDKLAPGTYRVTPTEALGRGEFCFFYAASANTVGGTTAGKLFDFGVDVERR